MVFWIAVRGGSVLYLAESDRQLDIGMVQPTLMVYTMAYTDG